MQSSPQKTVTPNNLWAFHVPSAFTFWQHIASILAVADITVSDMQQTDTTADVCMLFLLQEHGMF